jgi:hypothetical protein
MKRSGILLLVGGLMTGVFSITAYTTAGAGALTSQLPTISQGGGFANQPLLGDFREMTGSESENVRHEERIDPQLEPFDKACEESIREFYLRLAQEKEPQLEPFDKACEESIRESYLRLTQEKEPQLEPVDKACEESIKEFYLKVAQERQRVDSEFTLAK